MGMYLLKFSACLLVFWLVYILLLEQQKIHRFKRFYLLGSFVMALLIPLLTITFYVEPVVQQLESLPHYIPIESSNKEMLLQPSESINIETLVWYFYALGVLIFSMRFIVNLSRFYGKISKNEKVSKSSFIYVLLKEYRIPHSFFKFIFLNQEKFKNDAIPKEVLLHEETHAKQLHSLDIILIELLQIVFWFHPLVYVLKHHIKLNHEFLADQAVLNHGIDTKNYQNTLLQFSSNTQDYQLSSAINYSSFKKRFTVMKTQTSNTKKWVSTLLLLPIIAILFYSFAERKYVQKENTNLLNNIKEELNEAEKLNLIDTSDDPVKAYLKKYKAYKQLQDTPPHYIYKTEAEQKKMDALFSDLGGMYFRMLKADKTKVERPTPPISPYVKITLNGKTYYKKRSELTKEEKETLPPPPPPAMKKSKGGPNFENSSEVYNDYARSIELKIINDNSYLVDGIKATKKTFVDVFNQLHQDITPEVRNRILNIHVTSSKEISNKDVWFIYNSLKDYGFYRLVTPNQIVNRAKGNTPFAIESSNVPQQNPPTKKEIDAYNAWAKKKKEAFKKRPESETVNGYPYLINDETFRYYNSIYDRMTSEQKKKSVTLPEAVLVTEWPIPEYTVVETISQPIQEKATKQQIEEYNAWAKKINVAMRKARANKSNEYPIIKQKELNRYINIYKNLMTAEQRQNAEPFPSPPPTPPIEPPPSPLETIKTKVMLKTKQHNNLINKVEITIKKDKSLVLNGKQVALADFIMEVKKLNQHLTVEQQREYVFASILVESNKHVSFSKEIQEKLVKANVYQCAIGYNETKLKTGLPIKHFNLNEGLTVEEARKEREKMLREMDEDDKSLDKTIDNLNKKDNNKWSYTVETSFVESEPKMKELKYNGDTYSYYQKKGKNEFVFYDKYGLVVDKAKIKTLTNHALNSKKQ